MSDDSIPANDAKFDQLQKQLIAAVAANPGKYGCTAQDVTALNGAQAVWSPAYAGHIKAQDDAQTATHTKNGARVHLESLVRGAAHKINATAGTDNALRVSAGLPARDAARTVNGAPETRPLGRTEAKGHLTLVLHFVDEQTPKRSAKPQGVHGCEIWTYVGDTAPADASGYTFLALDTRTPYTDEHAAADAGKTVHYLLRWQNTKGEPGPWSDVVTAKIPL